MGRLQEITRTAECRDKQKSQSLTKALGNQLMLQEKGDEGENSPSRMEVEEERTSA
jgi:hypothetical protein